MGYQFREATQVQNCTLRVQGWMLIQQNRLRAAELVDVISTEWLARTQDFRNANLKSELTDLTAKMRYRVVF